VPSERGVVARKHQEPRCAAGEQPAKCIHLLAAYESGHERQGEEQAGGLAGAERGAEQDT
jgi:hypothetical protein